MFLLPKCVTNMSFFTTNDLLLQCNEVRGLTNLSFTSMICFVTTWNAFFSLKCEILPSVTIVSFFVFLACSHVPWRTVSEHIYLRIYRTYKNIKFSNRSPSGANFVQMLQKCHNLYFKAVKSKLKLSSHFNT